MTDYHIRATLIAESDRPRDVWVRDGRITFQPVDGAEDLATRGFLLPGLVDCHAHVALDFTEQQRPWTPELIEENLRAHLASGTLLVRDPGSPDGSSVAFQGERPGLPRVHAAGRFLAPEGRYLPFGQWTTPDELAAAASGHVRAGAMWVKVIADWLAFDKVAGELRHALNYDAETLGRAVAAVHAAGGRLTVHAAGPDGATAAVAAGVDCIEHGDGLDEALLKQCAAKGIAWTPTIAMSEALGSVTGLSGDAHGAFVKERFDHARQMLPIASRLGVTVLAGTDMMPHGTVATEIAALAKHGLTPEQAIAAGSTGARTYLGEPGIEEGAPADLVLYAADPRSTPELLASPALVMLRGQIVSRRK